MNQPSTEQRKKRTRWLTPILGFFMGFLCLVMGRVLYLQIAHGEELRKQSEVNRIRHEVLPARRGAIRDARGEILAADEPVFHLVRQSRDRFESQDLVRLASAMNLPLENLRRRSRSGSSRYLWKGLNDRQRIWFAEHRGAFEGLTVQIRPSRVYRFGEVTAPVLGYTGEIAPQELDRRRGEGLSQGNFVGKSGVEKFYDVRLQGRDGVRWIETTAQGDIIRVLESPAPIEPSPGDSLSLHVDVRLQERVAASFPADSEGAAVVMEVPSGRVRALYSHPSFDPNQLVTGQPARVKKLLHHPEDPLHNRVVRSRFPPGSTFKIIPYLAALRAPRFSPGTTFFCPGYYRLGGRTFRCWKEGGHGELDLDDALVHSCNVYFYKLIRTLGFERVARLARQLGYRETSGIDLPGEKRPQLASPGWKRRQLGRPWVPGDALNTVIGQGYMLVSPIKQAQLLGSLVTGRVVTPRVTSVGSSDTADRWVPLSASLRRRLIRTLDRVADEGTGYWAQHDPNYREVGPDLIGKTGTVQKGSSAENDAPPDDGWFLSAAPRRDPRYVVVVFRSEGGTGGDSAAPHARRIYRAMEELGYFANETGDPRRGDRGEESRAS